MSRASNYKTLLQFGCGPNDPITTNPYQLSLYNTIDKSFNNGVLGANYNASNMYSQEFMAQTCAANWNNVCELSSRDTTPAVNAISKFSQYYGQGTTVGDVTVRNSAVERFCDLNGCNARIRQLDPVDSTSPFLRVYDGQCIPVCRVDENTIDSDPIMNKMLDNPMQYRDIILNIYNTKKREGIDLRNTNTRIGKFLKYYSQYLPLQETRRN